MTDDETSGADTAVTYRLSTRERPSEGVVTAVAEATGLDPVPVARSDDGAGGVLDPLATAIDPDALDSMFGRSARDASPANGRFTFRYHDHEVTVHGGDRVTVTRSSSAAGTETASD